MRVKIVYWGCLLALVFFSAITHSKALYGPYKADVLRVVDGDTIEVAIYIWPGLLKTVRWYEGKHPCEKPLELMEHIIEASSLPGDLVLDAFAGSGSTAIACQNAGRRFVGCELGEEEFLGALGRVG